MTSSTRIAEACDYCGLPLGAVRRPPTATEKNYCCYGCHLAAEIAGQHGEAGHAHWMLARLGAGVVLSMAVMMFSLPNYGVDVYGEAPTETGFSTQWTGLLRYLSLLLSIPVFLLLGWPVFCNSIAEARRGVMATDSLVVLGVAAALIYSYINTLRDAGGIYFETACTVLVLLTLGRYLEASGKLRASNAIRSLDALLPEDVEATRQGRRETRRVRDLLVGDLVHIGAGQTVVVDGVIEEGEANVDESLVTGESTPIPKGVGHRVQAGTTNLDGVIAVRAEAVGPSNTIGRIAELLETAKNGKGRYSRLADRLSALFVPVVVCLALTAFGVHLVSGSAGQAIMTGLAVLLISCPCALGIATPLAFWGALGQAARRGVLFKDVESIEKLSVAKVFAFDKTGTLTTGQPQVNSFVAIQDAERTREEWAAVASGLARDSRHILSRAVADFGQSMALTPAVVTAIRNVAGRGVEGRVNGATVRLGSPAMMDELAIHRSCEIQSAMDGAMGRAHSLACLAWNDQAVGVFEFSERLRPEVPTALGELQSLGARVGILTGDHAARAKSLAQDLGVDVQANLAPGDKLACLESWNRNFGSVVMVGDGLNDAPALAGASVGMALGCGADVSRDAASVCLLGNDLRLVPWSFRLAKRTTRTIRVNLFWAFIYNVVGIPLALAGKLSPSFAALAMVLSSVFVVANSARLSRWSAETNS